MPQQVLPDFSNSVKLKYVKLGYQYLVNHILTFLLVPIMAAVAVELLRLGPDELLTIWRSLHFDHLQVLCSSFLVIFISTFYFMSKPRSIYLVDYACFKPSFTFRVPFATFMEHTRLIYENDPNSVEFQMRILERSGLGEETCLPPANHYIPPNPNMEAAREEAELVIFSAIDDLMKRTGIKPKDIDILILNCSLFSPTPSLSAMIVNKYKMRSNIKSFNLSGMGCSAGIISIDLARDLLQVHPNSYALVVSTEIITPNYYRGTQRSMLLPNCLFRMGAAAILLSNRRKDRIRAKYRLVHVVRTHKGDDDKAYRCVYEEEDQQGKVGISLSKDLMRIAGEALKSNITTIGPLVLPASEQLLFLFTLIGRKIINHKWKPYIPDFKQAFEHFCIHAGGRAVIDELQKNLQLSAEHVEASRMTLHRFGNTSSSSLWYELNYIETKGRMKKGDRVWQIAFGSGFKCNSAVWKCNRNLKVPCDGPWVDCIDRALMVLEWRKFWNQFILLPIRKLFLGMCLQWFLVASEWCFRNPSSHIHGIH
ncbi:3-ketoacyl-CoA synthase 6-like isoform X2 [Malania oleifera]|uniref:3-ketoacyl-CoA synthase 6-like isoform X2 n=1 Tax=Malania oleifera TaxID=397392 RepID=UPI0025AEC311|nr:3-ketoacyl-CoA synthase 6-like isoform X2 [Malania oleifera]